MDYCAFIIINCIVCCILCKVTGEEIWILSSVKENGICEYADESESENAGFWKNLFKFNQDETKNTIEECCDGYDRDMDTEYRMNVSILCIPKCDSDCINGNCTAPNVCTCSDGYKIQRGCSNVCKPICEKSCVNSVCMAPNECICHEGYKPREGQSNICDAKCNNCTNGYCIAPETCQCYNGYIRDPLTNVCVPQCNDGCINGQCIEPNQCKCNDGYQMPIGSLHVCEPICEPYCKNGKCISPNKCECDEGYKVLDANKPNECHCGLYCADINEECICLNENERVNSFQIHNDTLSYCIETMTVDGVYSKSCSCVNGFYTPNKECICINGYKMRDGFIDVCEPHCDIECINGVCIEPNKCQCKMGYQFDDNKNETNICYPHCDSGHDCGNGTCIAPNICKCNDGFVHTSKGKNSSKCIMDGTYTEETHQLKPKHSYIHYHPFFVGLFIGMIATSIFVAMLHFATFFRQKSN